MMVPVKILCACGQKYAFDVEPANGEMPWVVTCPSCGADGTAAANAAITHAAAAAASSVLTSIADTHLAVAPVALLPSGQQSVTGSRPNQVIAAPSQARSGSIPKDNSARELLEQLKAEVSHAQAHKSNAATSSGTVGTPSPQRNIAFVKMLVGIGLLFVPLVAYLALFLSMKNSAVPTKVFAVAVVVGLVGAWLVFSSLAATRSRRM